MMNDAQKKSSPSGVFLLELKDGKFFLHAVAETDVEERVLLNAFADSFGPLSDILYEIDRMKSE